MKFNNLGLALGIALKKLHKRGKRVDTKSQNVFGPILTVVEVTREKLGGGPFTTFPHPE